MKKNWIVLLFLFLFAVLTPRAFAQDTLSDEILTQAKAQADLFLELKNALGLDWLDKYNTYLQNPSVNPEPSWTLSVQDLINNGYLSAGFPSDFSLSPSGAEVVISRPVSTQSVRDAITIYLPSATISGNTVSLLVQRPAQWIAWQDALNGKVSRDGSGDPDILPGANLDFGSGSKIEFVSSDGKILGVDSLTYKGKELENRFVNVSGDSMTGPLYINGSVVWHAGNDGSGSGLDADLLDGQHGSFYRDASNLNTGVVPVARLSGTYNINISGNAATATKLATARTISLTGNVSGSASFDGSSNISINANVSYSANSDKLDGYHAVDFVKRSGDTMTGVLTAPEYRLNDANTRIYEGGNNSVRIQTDSGYVEIGPRNQSWAHFQTDRDKFYFNKPVNAVDELRIYNTSTYLTGSAGYIGGKRILTTDDLSSGGGWDVIIEDRKSSGTAGGTFSSGDWRVRTLNTIVYNNGVLESLSSNRFKLPAGTYIIDWEAPANDVLGHKSALSKIFSI